MARITLALLTEQGHSGGATAQADRSRQAGERRFQAVVRRFASAYEAHFFSLWRQPEPSIIPSLVRSTFRLDLEVERERALFLKALRLPSSRGRFVQRVWRKRVMGMRSLDDIQKQKLMTQLRAVHMFTEAAGDIEMVTTAVEEPVAALATFRQEFNTAFEVAMRQGAADAAQQVGFAADWTLGHPAAQQYMERYAGFYGDRLSKLVPMEWQSDIRTAIINGIDAGQGSSEMTAALQERFDGLKGFQALRIARTETVRAHVEGRRTSYAAMGVQTVEWISQGAPFACPICAARNGKHYPIDSPDLPPAPHPYCACDVSPPQSETNRLREEMFAELELPPAPPDGEPPRPPTPGE